MKESRLTDPTESIMISDQDYERLSMLIQHTENVNLEMLEDELSRAKIVPQKEIPNDIVTMNTKVQFIDEEANRVSEITLVYPKDADIAKMKVSVLAPIGMALLGLRLGQSIHWPMPNGSVRKLKVNWIVYQPEASQDWEL